MASSIVLILLVLWALPLWLLVWTLRDNRPRARRFLRVNDLATRPADEDVRRTYISRLAGGVVGLAIGAAAGGRLGIGFAIGGGGIGLLMGTLLGIALAQVRRARAPDGARSASLDVRDPANYRPPHTSEVTAGLTLFVVGYGTFAITTAHGELGVTVALFVTGFATVLSVPIGRWLQRRTIELQRADTDPDSIRVDDALRASAARGIHHATVGVLMCGLLILGYAATSTQSYLGVKDEHRVLLRTPTLTRTITADSLGSSRPNHLRVHWTEADGSRHTMIIERRGPRTITGNIWSDGTLLGIGYWVTIFGFIGAIIQWSRAAKAWRQPMAYRTAVAQSVAVTQ
jgi:hypothetical protein